MLPPARRDVLRAALLLPLARWSWGVPRPRSPRLGLRELRAEAEAEGRALLVALFPPDAPGRQRRGQLWGELLGRVSLARLFDLYLVHRAGLNHGELTGLEVEEGAFAVLFEPGAAKPRRLLERDLPTIQDRIEVAEDLGRFLHPDRAALVRREDDLLAALVACPRLATRPHTRALRRALTVRIEVHGEPDRAPRRALLTQALEPLLELEGSPPRFQGAVLTGEQEPCGPRPEPGCGGVPCGTAHVPRESRRFLRLLSVREGSSEPGAGRGR